MKVIRGQKPRTFPVGTPQSRDTLINVFGEQEVGTTLTVPEGQVLVVPEGGGFGEKETRHEFPAGTQFCVRRAGTPHTYTLTEIY